MLLYGREMLVVVTPRYTTGKYLGVCAHVFFDGDGNPSTKSDPRDKTSCGCL